MARVRRRARIVQSCAGIMLFLEDLNHEPGVISTWDTASHLCRPYCAGVTKEIVMRSWLWMVWRPPWSPSGWPVGPSAGAPAPGVVAR